MFSSTFYIKTISHARNKAAKLTTETQRHGGGDCGNLPLQSACRPLLVLVKQWQIPAMLERRNNGAKNLSCCSQGCFFVFSPNTVRRKTGLMARIISRSLDDAQSRFSTNLPLRAFVSPWLVSLSATLCFQPNKRPEGLTEPLNQTWPP